METSKLTAQEKLVDCLDSAEVLTDWECTFLDSLKKQFRENPDLLLSEKQQTILDKLHTKATQG